jgi:hypothetical protein
VQSVDRLGAGAHDVVAVLDHGAQRDDGVLDGGGAQPGRGQCGNADRDRVGVVVLATVPGGQHPNPSSQLGGHVHCLDPVARQPCSQRGTQTGGALDRPFRVGPMGGEAAQLPVALPAHWCPERGQRREG